MKPIRKMRLFAAALAVACLLAATVRTVAAGRGKAVLTGVVYGDGAPLAGVCVSDGVQFATTDAAGRYRIESDKSAGFVFAVTPSNWVAAEADGVQPLFWAALDEADARDEQHDFHFASVDQSRYTVMFFTDLHLTNSSEKRDLDHYRSIALASISDEAAQASARGPVYSLNLGDLSHDLYWYQYDFDVSSAKRFLEQNGFPTLLYSIPGNHDNDGATPAGVGVDRRAEHLYRRTFGPTYYAMNIGDVHWIMMDNIIYKNTPGKGKKNVGVVGARDYDKGFTPEQLAWLRRDLATVDASKTVCLCTHCPVFFDRDRRWIRSMRSSRASSGCISFRDTLTGRSIRRTPTTRVSTSTCCPPRRATCGWRTTIFRRCVPTAAMRGSSWRASTAESCAATTARISTAARCCVPTI